MFFKGSKRGHVPRVEEGGHVFFKGSKRGGGQKTL